MLGFLRGLIYGGLVSAIGLAAASIAMGPPNPPQAGVDAPAATEAPSVADAPDAEAGSDADVVTEEAASQSDAPRADTVAAAENAGRDTAPLPETGNVLATPSQDAVAEIDDTTVGVSSGDAPVAPQQKAPLPSVDGTSEPLSISTEPAQPVAPAVPQEETAFAPQSASEDSATDDAVNTQPEAATEEEAVTEAPAQTQEEAPTTEEASVPEAEQPETDAAETEDPAPAVVATDTTDEAATPGRVSIGTPATTLTDRVDEAPEEPAPPVPPLDAFAVPFEDPDGRPLMSIVLIDDGSDLSGGAVGPAALSTFPYPLSFAIDATLPDAAERMASYRARGFEVMAMIDLPAGATAQDAEANVLAAVQAVPEAVAVLEGPTTGVQADRDAADQVTAAVKGSGHGLVLQAKGLNTVQKLARKEGVPAAIVFRDFDSAGQTPTVMRRFLDQAAFRAAQEEAGVIMMGRVRPDTISALLLWGLQDRASRVALAPVSAILKALPDSP